MILFAVAAIAIWLGAATLVVGRWNPLPETTAQAPLGPMTPTFRDLSTPVVAELPAPQAALRDVA